MEWLIGLVVLVVAVLAYTAPAIVAYNRSHNDRMAIFALNILLGWTFVGWALALVWSLTSNVSKH